MDEKTILEIYDDISTITGRMLICAKAKDDVGFEALEVECKEKIAMLPSKEEMPKLSKTGINQKAAYLNKILNDDKEIRNVLEPWMVRLAKLITPSKNSGLIIH